MIIDIYWIILAIIKIIVTVSTNMIQKYYNFSGNSYPIITAIIAGLFAIFYALIFEDYNEIKKANYPILILFGFFLFIFLLCNYLLLKNSPHPGYFKILSVYELLIILFISYYFYNAEITLKNWIGFIFIIIGTSFLINT
jgi:drug/metabolite transporter (DMT)-like permease|tara:strand:- start:244 stop:663 length:420 start_codon:yes stop_codon:yes gene_type:complete